MKFFFPDSHDLVDPSFDFMTEKRSETRVVQRDDAYAHECFSRPPYDGLLLSKATVDGINGSSSRYTTAQRQRLIRQGVRSFFRLDRLEPEFKLETMGDCGAFSYVREHEPPYTTDQVIDFYEECGLGHGVSPDHVIFDFNPELDKGPLDAVDEEYKRRQRVTLDRADQFMARWRERKCQFRPVGAAQGWSPQSYADSVRRLQDMGYDYIGLGGMVPLQSEDIILSLKAIADVRKPTTKLHLFGVTRTKHLKEFASLGVYSFDSTSPLRQAFKDEKDNYHTMDTTYAAVRIPQGEGNNKLQKRILSGEVDHDKARRLELESFRALMCFDRGEAKIDDVLHPLREYQALYDGRKDRTAVYRRTLEEKPWKNCGCDICTKLGVHVILFRGAERNRRRGFHNVYVLYKKLQREFRQEQPRPRKPLDVATGASI